MEQAILPLSQAAIAALEAIAERTGSSRDELLQMAVQEFIKQNQPFHPHVISVIIRDCSDLSQHGEELQDQASQEFNFDVLEEILLSAESLNPVAQSEEIQPQEPEKPWMKFAGVFKNDPDFAAIVKTLREEREIDDDSPAYSLDDIE